ncbi:hypothetical protein CONPUDRAFT_60550, partial [Coniophora puteana RWD-64-598 SS2]
HFLTHIPHPMHKNSEMKAILSVGLTSIQSLPANHVRNTKSCALKATHPS